MEHCLKLVYNYEMLASYSHRLTNLKCLYLYFMSIGNIPHPSYHHLQMSGTTDKYSETYMYLCNFFFSLCFLFVAIIVGIDISFLHKPWLVATLLQQFSVFLISLASSIVQFNLVNKTYLSCILGTIITLNCITNWNRVHP